MNPIEDRAERLRFLARVVRRECDHLLTTDGRLFATPMTPLIAASLASDADLSERVEAFVGRFGRLQDTLGDKLLPTLLLAMGERTGAAIDNLDRAEKLGILDSADRWTAMRELRNRMIHEYLEDPVILSDALQSGHEFVPVLSETAGRMLGEMQGRGWI